MAAPPSRSPRPSRPAPAPPPRRPRCATCACDAIARPAARRRAGGRSGCACRCRGLRLTIRQSGSARPPPRPPPPAVPALEPRVARAEDDALQPPVAGHQLQPGGEERAVVLAGRRVQQVDAGQVALAALRGRQPARAADGEQLAAQPLLARAGRAAGRARRSGCRSRRGRPAAAAADQLDLDRRRRPRTVSAMRRDGDEAVGLAERGDRAGALADRVGGEPVRCRRHERRPARIPSARARSRPASAASPSTVAAPPPAGPARPGSPAPRTRGT